MIDQIRETNSVKYDTSLLVAAHVGRQAEAARDSLKMLVQLVVKVAHGLRGQTLKWIVTKQNGNELN